MARPDTASPPRRRPRGLLAAVVAVSLVLVAPSGAAPRDPPPAPETTLAEHLEGTRAEGYLPLRFAVAAASEVDVFFHDGPELALAFSGGELDALLTAPGGSKEPSPARAVLSLYRPAYLDGARWRPVTELTVDAAEYLFNTLARLYLEREVTRGSELGRRIEARAGELLADLPAAVRTEAYVSAASDFVSHALAVASQLERSARLHESRGTDVCAHLDAPWTLFALWDRIFGDEVYEATYFPEARRGDGPAADAPRPIRTRVGLAAEDKALLERTLLEGRWQGDRRSDLASRYCPG